MTVILKQGDCRELLKTLPNDSVDSVVCDPPYELTANKKGGSGLASLNTDSPAGRARISTGFMGKSWDATGVAFDVNTWIAVLRVLKPGGHLLAFGGTRTHHRMTCAIEDAGFEIRDELDWLYASGFPKSLNISKTLAKTYKIGLCTCSSPRTLNRCEVDDEQKNIHTGNGQVAGHDDGRGTSKTVFANMGVSYQPAPVSCDTPVSEHAGPERSAVRQLRKTDNEKCKIVPPLEAPFLRNDVCQPVSENQGQRNSALRKGLEGNSRTGSQPGQSVSGMWCSSDFTSIGSSPSSSVSLRGQEYPLEFGVALPKLPQPSGSPDNDNDAETTNNGNSQPANIDRRFVCSECGGVRRDMGGSALKPAREPIILARKRMTTSIVENIQKYGTGALNIDACRIGTGNGEPPLERTPNFKNNVYGKGMGGCTPDTSKGRWPANIILDETAAQELDAQSGITEAGETREDRGTGGIWHEGNGVPCGPQYGDIGGASRFFYVAKASRSERELGCEHLPVKTTPETVGRDPNSAGVRSPRAGAGRGAGTPLLHCTVCGCDGGGGRYVSPCIDGTIHNFEVVGTGEGVHNFHPTVKPLALCRYLCRLITPPGGVVLDPFMGSGTTGCGAVYEGFRFIGFDLTPEYVEIAKARIAYWSTHKQESTSPLMKVLDGPEAALDV